MSDAELRQKVAKEWAKKTGSEYCCRDGFEEGWDAARANLEPRVERLIEALKRLTRVGPPSRSCKGNEWAGVCLQDNCEIAEAALAEWEKGE